MGKLIGRSLKYNRSKISTPTLKKYVSSYSAAHKSSASNLTQTSISSQLDNKGINKNKNFNQIILMNVQNNVFMLPVILKEYNLFSQNTESSLEQ